MKLSKTMIVESTTLPNNVKAFTLAEVLITLSILGVVAAITVPQMIRYQSEKTAITKMKKAISIYEKLANDYIAETGDTNLSDMVGTQNCDNLKNYIKMTQSVWISDGNDYVGNTGCLYTTSDGALWFINKSGNAVVHDSVNNPRYGVVMWTKDKLVNFGDSSDNFHYGLGVPNYSSDLPSEVPSYTVGTEIYVERNVPIHGYYTAAQMLSIKSPQKTQASTGIVTPSDVLNIYAASSSPTNDPSPTYDPCEASGICDDPSPTYDPCEASGICDDPSPTYDPSPSTEPYIINTEQVPECTNISNAYGCRCDYYENGGTPFYSCEFVPDASWCLPTDTQCWNDYYAEQSPSPEPSP
ncbi:type II secretion system protein [bacterium]|nr:type II secretion system protein [bacterium]